MLCEIQTDKAVVAMEVDEEGVLAKIVVKEDVPDVSIGRVIAVLAESGEDWKSVSVRSSSFSLSLLYAASFVNCGVSVESHRDSVIF